MYCTKEELRCLMIYLRGLPLDGDNPSKTNSDFARALTKGEKRVYYTFNDGMKLTLEDTLKEARWYLDR